MKINFPLTTALALAAIGAAVSLYGLVMMLGFYFLPLGAALELGKLTSAASLHRQWAQLNRFVSYTLTAIVLVLMTLTSGGVYSFVLTRYLAHVAAIEGPATERIAAADEDVRRQVEKVADIDKQLANLDATPALEITQIAAAARAQAEAAKLRAADQQRRQAQRNAIAAKRDAEAVELVRLRTARAEVGSQAQAAAAEVGPTKVVADLLGIDPGKVVAAAIASIYDALCILLLICAGSHKSVAAAAPVAEITKPIKTRKRSAAARRGWATRKRKAMVVAHQSPVVRVK
jgi:hypothetical protein